MNKKRILFGAFWFFNIIFGVLVLYMAVAVQLGIYDDSTYLDAIAVKAKSVGNAFQLGYQHGLVIYKNVAVHFFKTYGLKLALFAFIIAGIGKWFGWLPGTKPNLNTDADLAN